MKHYIEQIIEQHPALEPRLFVCSTVSALLRHGSLPRKDYKVRLKNCPKGECEQLMELDCKEEDVLREIEAFVRTLQAEDVTEYAAIGLALLYVAEYTELRVVEATQRGDRADYWMGIAPGDKQKLLEVSGLDRGNETQILKRENEKIEQVRKNKFYKKDFYVAIAEFANGISIFSRNGNTI